MFHNAITAPGADSDASEGGLRPVTWEELVARLAAARELYAVLSHRTAARAGSFGGLSAPFVNEKGAGVNPTDLAHGKDAGGNTAPHHMMHTPATES